MVHIITQIFTSVLAISLVGGMLCVRDHKIVALLGALVGAPLGWIGENICIALGFFDYSIQQLIPILWLPLPVWFGWFFVMLYGSIILVYMIESVQVRRTEFQESTFNGSFLKIFGISTAIYLAPVCWGLLIASPIYLIHHAIVGNWNIVSQIPLLWGIFGLDPFSYFIWIALMLAGVFLVLLIIIQIEKNKTKLPSWKKLLIIPLGAFCISPLGWGIEFYGVNSHSPIWTYVPQGNPLFVFGPFNIPIIIYLGWFVFLGIVTAVLSYKMGILKR